MDNSYLKTKRGNLMSKNFTNVELDTIRTALEQYADNLAREAETVMQASGDTYALVSGLRSQIRDARLLAIEFLV